MYRTALSWHSTKSLDIYVMFNCRAVCLLKVGFVYNTSLLQIFFYQGKKMVLLNGKCVVLVLQTGFGTWKKCSRPILRCPSPAIASQLLHTAEGVRRSCRVSRSSGCLPAVLRQRRGAAAHARRLRGTWRWAAFEGAVPSVRSEGFLTVCARRSFSLLITSRAEYVITRTR